MSTQIKVHISADHSQVENRKVVAIKAVRNATGLGLKEAKEAVDLAETGGCSEIDVMDMVNARLLSRDLQGTGYKATINVIDYAHVDQYLEELRAIASQAILAGDTAIANDLVQLINRYEIFSKEINQ